MFFWRKYHGNENYFRRSHFLGRLVWFYLFLRQLLFNLCTAFPLIKAMNTAQPELIAVGAKRYTIVSLCSCLVVFAIVVAIVVIFCPLYLLISFFVGAAVGLIMYIGKLSPKNRPMFDAFCNAYYRFVPDDELRTHMYNKDIHKMKLRLHTLGVSKDWIPDFKEKK